MTAFSRLPPMRLTAAGEPMVVGGYWLSSHILATAGGVYYHNAGLMAKVAR